MRGRRSAALIRDNRIAFNVALLTCGAGLLLIVVALAGWRMEYLSGFVFMILIPSGPPRYSLST
jgi:hypothetical protein